MSTPARQRLAGLDACKGLAIAAVVLIHAAWNVRDPRYLEHVVGGVARLGVPIFVLASGFLAGWRGLPRLRARRYALRFLRLHLIYGLFYWALDALVLGVPQPSGLRAAALRFGEGAWAGQYFFWILILLHGIAGGCLPERYWERRAALPGALALLALALAVHHSGWLAALPEGPLRSLVRSDAMPWLWLFPFVLGARMGSAARGGAAPAPPFAVGALALALAIAAFGLPLAVDQADAARFAYTRPRIFVATALVALALPALAARAAPRALTALGRESFGIFVFNAAVLLVLTHVLGPARSVPASWLYFAVALATSLALGRAVRRFAPWAYA